MYKIAANIAPNICAKIKIWAVEKLIPVNDSVKILPSVTAGFAKHVEDVNHIAEKI